MKIMARASVVRRYRHPKKKKKKETNKKNRHNKWIKVPNYMWEAVSTPYL